MNQQASPASARDAVAGDSLTTPRPPPPILSVRTQRLLSTALLAVAFAVNAWLTWLKLGSITLDCGRELDIARQLNEGRVLYRDLRYYYGPLAPWLNAALFRVLGTHTTSLRVGGLLCAAAACILLYRLSRCFVNRAGSVAIVLLFQFACVFAHLARSGVFNFVMPYSQAATYGITVALASVFFLIRYARKEKTADFCWSVAFLFLVSLAKLELLVAVLATHVVFVAARMFARRLNLKLVLSGYGICACFFFATYAWIVAQVGRDTFFGDNIAAPLNNPNYRQYTADIMGIDNIPASLRALGCSALALGAAAALIYLANRLADRARFRVLAFALGIGTFLIYFYTSPDYAFATLPLLSAAFLVALFVKAIRRPAERNTLIPEALLWTFALALTSRMGLKCISYQFGFFLLAPSLVGLGVILFRTVPGKRPAPAAIFTGVCMLLGISANNFTYTMALIGTRTHEIRTPYGHEFEYERFFGIPLGACYEETIRLLSTLPPNTPVVVLPQGQGLLSYAGLTNPYGTSAFSWAELSGDYDDDHVLARFKANPPRVVIWLKNGDPHANFGQDYLVKTHIWFAELYEPCLSLGPEDFILFYKLKAAPFPFPSLPPERRNIPTAH